MKAQFSKLPFDISASSTKKIRFETSPVRELASIDAKISGLIGDKSLSTAQLSAQLQRLERRLDGLYAQSCLELLKGTLSPDQRRFSKYIHREQMSDRDKEIWRGLNTPETTLQQLQIAKLTDKVKRLSRLYSIAKAEDLFSSGRSDDGVIEPQRQIDRYAITSTSRFDQRVQQVKLLLGDFLFMLTSLIKSVYFHTLSTKVRFQILHQQHQLASLMSKGYSWENISPNPLYKGKVAHLETLGHEQERVQAQSSRVGMQLRLRYLGQLNLNQSIKNLITFQNLEILEKSLDQIKEKVNGDQTNSKKMHFLQEQHQRLKRDDQFNRLNHLTSSDRYFELMALIDQASEQIRGLKPHFLEESQLIKTPLLARGEQTYHMSYGELVPDEEP